MKRRQHHSAYAFAVMLHAFLLTHCVTPNVAAQDIASSLTRPATPEKPPGTDGFLQRWVILDPISHNGLGDSAVRAAVAREFFPDQLSVVPRDGETVTIGGAEHTWRAVDTKNYNINLYHLAYANQKPTSNVLFWAVTTVNCPEEMSGVRLAIGSNAASVWWVNGEEVIGIYGERQTTIDDGVSKKLALKKGANVIRCAVINAGGATDFCARFLGQDEKPLMNLTLSVGEVKK
jgi:hypothetical protein